MRTTVAIFLVVTVSAAGSAGEVAADELDPKRPEDRKALLQIVKRSSNGNSGRAARILAKAGYMDDLLEILKATTSYNTMQAIARTGDERAIPVFEARLRTSPENRHLVESLAYLVEKLDPKRPENRKSLLQIVKRSSNGKSSRAAKILAEAGHMDDLLEILKATASYNTMQAIARTGDERAIPVFEARLRKSPGDRYLVGSLASLRNRKASPILLELLKRHPDSASPSALDIVASILHATVVNKCQDATPILRQRFAACSKPSQANRKSNYAITLLSLGDPIGISWLREHIRKDIASKRQNSSPVERLAMISSWMHRKLKIVAIQDESIMAPLLLELVKGTSLRDWPPARDCCRTLKYLTRHDFKQGTDGWRQWYEKHAGKHPIYSRPLDRAVKHCIDRFAANVAAVAKTNERVRWMHHYLPHPERGVGAPKDFLSELQSHPEQDNRWLPKLPFPRKTLGVHFQACLTSKAPGMATPVFEQEFKRINVTVRLCLSTDDQEARRLLIDCATRACTVLSDYESFWARGQDREQGATGDADNPRR